MAEKFKKRLSRRAQERLHRALRAFDLTLLGLILTAVLCAVICYFRGADLREHASSGFAYWFLVVVGYLPMLLVNVVRAIAKLPIPATGEHTELYLHCVVVLIWVTTLGLTVRILGKRNSKSQLLHIGTRIAQIILCWGVFQLCCWAITVGLNRGWRTVGKPQTKSEIVRPTVPPPAKTEAPKAEAPKDPAATAKTKPTAPAETPTAKAETPKKPAAPAAKK